MSKESLYQLEQRYKQKFHELSKLQNQMDNIRRSRKLPLTDHALVRYMERILNINPEDVHKKIVTPQLVQYHTTLGDGTFPIGVSNIRAVIKNGIIVTILT